MDLYPVCSKIFETLIHALWECPRAFDIWDNTLSPLKKRPSQFPDFQAFWLRMTSDLPLQELVVSTLILCNIWFRNNALYFQNLFENPPRLIQRAIKFYEDYHHAQSGLSERHQVVLSTFGPRNWLRLPESS